MLDLLSHAELLKKVPESRSLEKLFENFCIFTESTNSWFAELVAGNFIGNIGSHKNRNINAKTFTNLVRDKTKTIFWKIGLNLD